MVGRHVRFPNGPKRAMRHLLGGEIFFFLIREIDDAAMAGASAESCRFVGLRSPRGRLGAVLYTCKRLRRMRGRFHRYIHISTGPQPDIGPEPKSPKFWIQSSLESPSTVVCGLGDYPTPDLSERESESRSASEKSK